VAYKVWQGIVLFEVEGRNWIMKNAGYIQYLNKLIRLNYDRIACYELAIYLLNQLKLSLNAATFLAMHVQQSRKNIRELVNELGTHQPVGTLLHGCTSFVGKTFLIWMHFRSIFSAKPVDSIVSCCKAMDEMVINGCNQVINTAKTISDDTRQRLLDHRIALESSHASLNTYRSITNTYAY
jgi:hypothetical protein